MYSIYAGDVLIFSDSSPNPQCKVVDPKLSLDAESAGTLSFTVPVGVIAYSTDILQRIITTVSVKREGKTIWVGRVMSESTNFYNEREITCEGALAFLNDTVQTPATYYGSVSTIFSTIIGIHNNKVEPNRRITVGTVTVSGNVPLSDPLELKYDKTYDVVSNKLVGDFGGILRVRYENDGVYLDWLAEYPEADPNHPPQTIEFGKNLLEFTRNWDMNEFVTVVYARGAKIETETENEGESAQEAAPEQYVEAIVQNAEAVAAYGPIETFQEYSDIENLTDLQTEAQRYLNDHQFDEMTLDFSAVDLHMIDRSIKPFELFDVCHIISRPHGLDRNFSILNVDISLNKVEETSYKVGDATVAYKRRVHTLTRKQKQERQEIEDRIEEEHDYTEQGLEDARDYTNSSVDDAKTEMTDYTDQQVGDLGRSLGDEIQGVQNDMNARTVGHITIVKNSGGTASDAIYISDTEDWTHATRLWKWDSSGLGFSSDGGTTWDVAITSTGKIMGDMILANTILTTALHLYGDVSVYQNEYSQYIGGYMGYGQGHNGYDTTYGIHMYTGYNQEIIVTNSGARMTFGSSSLYVDGNDANANCDMFALNFYPISDRNAKKNIEYNPDKYRALFDLLKPCSFEYKKTESDIRHNGFIAQDIEDVLADADLKPEEFGCLRKREIVDPITQEKRIEYSLGYNDLIPLCVDQIQELKKRVSDLEAKVNGEHSA